MTTARNDLSVTSDTKPMEKTIPPEKFCKVCGDRAVGYNFGIVTCESCKAFFRRNSQKTLSCPFKSVCEITVLSRRHCQACRLKKCLKEGMQKDSIDATSPLRKKSRMDELIVPEMADDLEKAISESTDDFVRLPKRLAENLAKTINHNEPKKECVCTCTCGFYPPNTRLTQKEDCASVTFERHEEKSDVKSEQLLEYTQASQPNNGQNIEIAHSSSSLHYPVPSVFFSNSYALPSEPYAFAPAAVRLSESIPYDLPVPETNVLMTVNEYTRMMGTPTRTYNESAQLSNIPACLSSREKFLLEELIRANSVLTAPMELSLKDLDPNELSLLTVVRISDLAMRRIIDMAKKLSAFMSTRQEDQIALLKGGLSELLILRGVMVFEPHLDIWNLPTLQGSKEIQLNVNVLKKTPEEKHYEEHKRFLMSFDEKWRKNEKVMLILNAITLFSPSRANIYDSAAVAQSQREYYDLLQSYLSTQCCEIEAREAYESLMQKLDNLRQLNQSLQRIYSQLNPKDLDPLLRELFVAP